MRRPYYEKHSGYDKAKHRGMLDVGIVEVRRTHNRNTGAVKHELLLRPHGKVSPGRAGAEIMPGGKVRFWGQSKPGGVRSLGRALRGRKF